MIHLCTNCTSYPILKNNNCLKSNFKKFSNSISLANPNRFRDTDTTRAVVRERNPSLLWGAGGPKRRPGRRPGMAPQGSQGVLKVELLELEGFSSVDHVLNVSSILPSIS
jgi:hypothetical protein